VSASIVFVGMPESGKSSFLAALRHLLVSREIETALELERFAGGEAHANGLSRKWHEIASFERTSMEEEGEVSVIATCRDTGEALTLSLPDLSGERFEQLAGNRTCPAALHKALLAADGVLLFVNACKEFQDASKDDFGRFGPGGASAAKATAAEAREWDPAKMPEQAQLLEILNFLNRYPSVPRRRRLAVIVSAWDVVDPSHALPSSWLEQHRFLLWSFLLNNPDLFDARFYGVSAIGGDPRDPEAVEELRKVVEPSRRIRVVGHGTEPHDLSSPLRWLAEG